MSNDRLRKLRNTINTALGAQKGKRNASLQAIEKWKEDIKFVDDVLKIKIWFFKNNLKFLIFFDINESN